MDPLVISVIGVVSPYLAKGAEEFAKQTGAAAFNAAKSLVTRLSQWWKNEPVAEAAANSFAKDPERYAKVLAAQLEYDVKNDESLAADLRKLVADIGPSVDVIQKMEVARGVTGADIGSLLRGTVRVEQNMRDAQDVTGVRADRVGGE
jgi:hypothetical protein